MVVQIIAAGLLAGIGAVALVQGTVIGKHQTKTLGFGVLCLTVSICLIGSIWY